MEEIAHTRKTSLARDYVLYSGCVYELSIRVNGWILVWNTTWPGSPVGSYFHVD